MTRHADTDGDSGATESAFLEGRILIAMPSMGDPRFQRSLIYLCAHSADGAMGLVINREAEGLTLSTLFEKLDIPSEIDAGEMPVHYGGPVEPGRGFVLHSSDYCCDSATLEVDDETAMTATLEVLHAMAAGRGPRQAIVALGYAGWAPGQLEAEIRQNGWLCCDSDSNLLFGPHQETKWDRALAKLGIDPALLATTGGSA